MVAVELKPGPNEQEDVDKQGAQVQAQSYSEKDPHVVEVREQKEAGLGVIHPASVEGSVVVRGYQVFVRHVHSVVRLTEACFEGLDP